MCNGCSHGTLLHTRPSRISLEYLLLPPRSAPAAAPRRLAPVASAHTAASLLLTGAYLPGGGSGSSAPAAGYGPKHTLSAIHFQGWLIRQVSCYTLLSGFRLPWPPSCCLKQPTPFVGSDELLLWHFNPAFGSSPRRLFSNTQIFEFSNPSLLDVKPTQGAFACCLSHAHGYSPYIFQPLSEMGSTISKVTRT